jgi:hypothetical protein
MSGHRAAPPATFSTAGLVDDYDLTFDPGDPRNASLYLCTPRGAPGDASEWVKLMRAAGLWSETPEKSVPDAQRGAYREGLIFVAAIPYRVGSGHLVLARFDHPRFPSDSQRWEAWVDLFDVRHERWR